MVAALGKTVMGWQEIATVPYAGDRVVQYWRPEPPGPYLRRAVAQGARVVLSPANRSYLDMVYGPGTAYQGTPLGLDWAGPVEVRDAYDWDPGSYLEGVPEESVLGVEAPLWSETVSTPEHLDYLTFPRLPAIAEVGWSRCAGLGRVPPPARRPRPGLAGGGHRLPPLAADPLVTGELRPARGARRVKGDMSAIGGSVIHGPVRGIIDHGFPAPYPRDRGGALGGDDRAGHLPHR